MQAGRDVFWDEAVAESPGELEPLEVDSEHPYLLTYTSGTTGPPKGVLHVQGGFLVSITREVAYQADAKPGDVIHFVTDMGWIMGPWEVVGGMALGCTIVFAEGAPDWPAADRLWGLVESERVSILGLSPTLVRALIPHGAELVERHDLSSLRVLVTTGEPWNPEPYRWLFEHVGGGRCPIINCSGGTEVGACFLSPTPAAPIKACSLGGPGARDGDGRRRRRGPLGSRRGRRARLPAAVPGHDARLLARLASATSTPTGAGCPGSGCTATGPRSTRTATGSCTAAPTTRSTSRASGSGRPSSSRRWSPTRRSPRPPRSACRTR